MKQFLWAVVEIVTLYAVAVVFGEVISRLPIWTQSLYIWVKSRVVKFENEVVTAAVSNATEDYLPEIEIEEVETTKPWPALPTFLGMLIAGIIASNMSGLIGDIPDSWSYRIRKVALTIILARAGLNMDMKALKSYGKSTLRLASIPCLSEATISAMCARLLTSMDWGFCFCLGFMVAAVSPAVVVPSLLVLQEAGFGVAKGIPTMILAAASLDDVISICGLGLAMDVAFARLEGGGNGASAALWTVLVVPFTVIGGITVGILFGAIQYGIASVWFPRTIAPLFHSDWSKTVVLIVLCQVVVEVAGAIGYEAAGYLAVMVSGFVAARGWEYLDDHDSRGTSDNFKLIWQLIMPGLFMLIGAQVNLSSVSPGMLQLAIGILLLGLMGRILVTYSIMLVEPKMLFYERLFVALAWMPKATVQAALGSVVLDRALSLSISDDSVETKAVDAGKFILTAAVLVILITAPIGAIAIFVTGPRWLDNSGFLKAPVSETEEQPVEAPASPRHITTTTDISCLSVNGRVSLGQFSSTDDSLPIYGVGEGTVERNLGELVFVELV